MNRPQIPGFYFDEERNRYFKITNGDQRLNSTYSNNSVRAEERRKEEKRSRQPKRSKKEDKRSAVSLDSVRKQYPINFQKWFLRRKLEYGLPYTRLLHQMPNSPTTENISFHVAWPFTEVDKVIVFDGIHLDILFEIDFRAGNHTKPIFRLDFPQVFTNGRKISRVESSVGWLSLWFGSQLSLYRWDSNAKKLTNIDYASHLLSNLRSVQQHQENERLAAILRDTNSNRHFCHIEGDKMHLLSDSGHWLKICLETFTIKSCQNVSFEDDTAPFDDSLLLKAKNTLLYNVGRFLVLINRSHRKVWKFDSPIYAFSVTRVDTDYFEDRPQDIARLYIVTAKEIIIRDYNNKLLESLGTDVVIPHGNDNQARPLIWHARNHILVEERPDTFKVVDTKFLVTKTVKIDIPFPSPRESRPRMFQCEENFYVSHSQGTHVILNVPPLVHFRT